jgi:hypothetical protein
MTFSSHHIRNASFTIHVNSEKNALALRHRISDVIKKRLLHIADEVFSSLEIPSVSIRIPRLDIDLGKLNIGDIDHNLEQRFRKVLQASLSGLLANVSEQRSGRYSFAESGTASLEKLQSYLREGNFPWWADVGTSFNELFEEQLREEPKQLIAIINKLAREQYIVKRIAYHLDERLLIRFIEAMDLPFDQFVFNYVQDLKKTHRLNTLIQTSSIGFEKTIWRFVLTYLLVDRGSTFNQKEFLKWNIQRIAGNYGIAYETLLRFLANCMRSIRAGKSSLSNFITQLNDECFRNNNANVSDRERLSTSEDRALEILEHFLLHGESTEILETSPRKIFRGLSASKKRQIASMIERLGQREVVLDRIQDHLPMDEVVHLIEPDEYAFIILYVSGLKLSHKKEPVIKAPLKDFAKVAWKFILQYLVTDRGTNFNRKSFVKSNLAHIARKYNVEYGLLLNFMASSMVAAAGSSGLRGSLPLLFQDLQKDQLKENSDNTYATPGAEQHHSEEKADVSPEQTVSLVNTLDKYDALHAFEHWAHCGEWPMRLRDLPDLNQWLSSVIKNYASEIRTILEQKLASDTPVGLALAEHFSVDSIRGLFGMLMSTGKDGDKHLAVFLKSLEHYAAQSTSPGLFYKAVVGLILKKEPLDFEEIQNKLKESTEGDKPIEYYQALVRRVIILENVTPGEAGAANVIKQYMQIHPSDCRALLLTLGQEDDNISAKLTNHLADGDLQDIIALLQPGNASLIKEYMRWIRTASTLGLIPQTAGKTFPAGMIIKHLLQFKHRVFNIRVFMEATLSELLVDRDTHHIVAKDFKLLSNVSGHTTPFLSLISASVQIINERQTQPVQKKDVNNKESLGLNKALAVSLFLFLVKGHAEKNIHHTTLQYMLLQAINREPDLVARFVRKYILKKEIRERWPAQLPPAFLLRFIGCARYSGYEVMVEWMEVLSDAVMHAQPPGTGINDKWKFLLAYLAEVKGVFKEKPYLKKMLTMFSGTGGQHEVRKILSAAINLVTEAGSNNKAVAVLRELKSEIDPEVHGNAGPALREKNINNEVSPKKPVGALLLKPQFALDSEKSTKPMYIKNAGLVLLHAYFPQYFRMLGLLDRGEDNKEHFKNESSISKAVHALQYLVSKRTDTPEPELLLNKILCGCPLSEPIVPEEEMIDAEKRTSEGLLMGAIKNWPPLVNTSPDGLRTFLHREGKLFFHEDRWDLEVENKTVDILLEQLPWSISVIRMDWMPQTLHVKWRK